MAVNARLELPSPLGDIEGLAFVVPLAWAELPSPLGGLNVLAHVVPLARATLPSPLGDLKVVAGPIVRRARVALSSPLGALAAVGFVPRGAQLSLPSPLGALLIQARSIGDAWGSAGFPLPRLQGYIYQRDAGLVRTEMLSGITLQRRKWTNGYRQATVSFEIPTADLYDMEGFLDSKGYDWFGMRMVTADNVTNEAETHSVRVIDNPSFGEVYGENISVSLSIELADPLGVVIKPFNPSSDFAIIFIDEAHQAYTTDYPALAATAAFTTDLALFQGLPAGIEDRILVFFVRNEIWETANQWVLYPSGTASPVSHVVTCPRVGTGGRPDLPVDGTTYLSGQFVYDAVEAALGFPTQGFRRAHVFVDTSGSMAKENLGTALDEFYLLASGKLVCNELICSTERWLRWIYNVNDNSSECV